MDEQKKNSGNIIKIALSGGLSAMSCALQLIHIGFQSSMGMWIDFVSFFWIVAYFLLGFRYSLLVSVISSVFIALFSPDNLLGAVMKFAATMPLVVSFEIFRRLMGYDFTAFSNPAKLIIPSLTGILLRLLIILPLNYFYALPLWTNMSPYEAFMAIPWQVIALFNLIQSVLDIILSYLLVYKMRINRYSKVI